MSNEVATKDVLQPFSTVEFEGKEFDIYGDFQSPLFLAKDVAEWIDYSYKDKRKTSRDVSKMLKSVDEDEKLVGTLFHSGQNREMWFLTEQGMYEVLMQSRKPIAKEAKKNIKGHLKRLRTEGITMHEALSAEQQAEILVSKLDEIYAKQEEELLNLDAEIELLEEQVLILKEECEEINKQIEDAKPFAEKYHEFLEEEAFMSIDDFARITYPRYNMGRNKMFKYMRQKRMLGTGSKKNMPHRKLVRADILKLIKGQVFITKKGFDYLCDSLDEHFGLAR